MNRLSSINTEHSSSTANRVADIRVILKRHLRSLRFQLLDLHAPCLNGRHRHIMTVTNHKETTL